MPTSNDKRAAMTDTTPLGRIVSITKVSGISTPVYFADFSD
jgi:hypothetical protein